MDYKRKLKNDWKAKWIWKAENEKSTNAWFFFNKTVSITDVPQILSAKIAAENKYWLYINGKCAVREGGLKRGPTPTGCYYDEIDIAPYLVKGKNLISILVWYWGNEVSYSNSDAGQGGLLFEAVSEGVSIVSDSSWSVKKHPAFKEDKGEIQPNYRLPESNVYYDARENFDDWYKSDYDFSDWSTATEYEVGGQGIWGEIYNREIPMFKDFGLKNYVNSSEFEGELFSEKTALQITPGRVDHL